MSLSEQLLSVQETACSDAEKRDYQQDAVPAFGKRYCTGTALHVGLLILYVLRVVLSQAIVPMADEFSWKSDRQGLILSSFFFGYLFLEIPGGWLATKYGGKQVWFVGVLAPSLLTIIIPFVASRLWLLLLVRVLTGVFESVTYPSLYCLIGRWAPRQDKSSIVSLVWSGAFTGTAIAFPMAGALIDSPGGWQSVFYVSGGLGVLYCVAVYPILFSSPREDKQISAAEREFIENNLPPVHLGDEPVPWRVILTSWPVWVVVIAHVCHNWGLYTLLTWAPSYLKHQLHFSISGSGFVSSLPYVATSLVSFGAGWVADSMVARGWRLRLVRNVMQGVAELVPAVTLVILGFVSSQTIGVVLLTIATGALGACTAGFASSYMDISPYYAGILMSLSNFFATIPGVVSPYLTGVILAKGEEAKSNVSAAEWRVVFYIASSIYVTGYIVYFLWVRVEPLPDLEWVPDESSGVTFAPLLDNDSSQRDGSE